MNYILIETVTPLHIGSGRTLQSNTEYLYFEESKTVSIIDERKVLSIIGEEYIEQWVNIIEKGSSLLAYLKKRIPDILPGQTDKRLLKVNGTTNPSLGNSGVREHLFSGNGQALLAGSSLKGAIRTAIFNQAILKKPSYAKQLKDFKETDNRNRVKYKGVQLEKKYFGKDPNHDIFRLLRIGDAHFDKTECILAETLNQTGKGYFMKDAVKQHIECIPVKQKAICRIQIPEDLIREINKRPLVSGQMSAIDLVKDVSVVFSQIKAHTNNLLTKEISKYEVLNLPDSAIEYVDSLKEIQATCSMLSDKECIIRVGFGTGYLNMTGGWAIEQWKDIQGINYHAEMEALGTAVRKNSSYNTFDLPKSRKMVLGGIPLGYIKLKIVDAAEAKKVQDTLDSERINNLRLRQESEAQLMSLAQQKAEEFALNEQQRLVDESIAQEKALEEAKRLAEEAKKPKMYEGALPKGKATLVDAIVLKSGKSNIIRVFVNGYESKEFPLLRYTNLLDKDTALVVKASTKKDGTIYEVIFDKVK